MNVALFQGGTRPTLGVELEFQLVDARSLALADAASLIIADTPAALRGSVKPEFYECCVEVNSGVCNDIGAVERDLEPKLAATARTAAGHGVRLAWGGTHPFSHWRDQAIVPTPRYRALAEHYRDTLCRQLTFGMHVHVGVPDGDAAVRGTRGVVEHLPALLALSVNSPFWCGRATGLHSQRIEVMSSSPTAGLAPRLTGWSDYVQLVRQLASTGMIGSQNDLWWDVRPSPVHGTVEVRMCDMPPDLPSALALAALIQCLVVDATTGALPPIDDECGLAIVRQNRWRASRYGLGAEFVDPRTGCRSPAREAVAHLVRRMRRVAESLGCARQLEWARAMADGPSGAERQLAAFERSGDLAMVIRGEMAGHALSPAADCKRRGDRAVAAGHGIDAVHGSWSSLVNSLEGVAAAECLTTESKRASTCNVHSTDLQWLLGPGRTR